MFFVGALYQFADVPFYSWLRICHELVLNFIKCFFFFCIKTIIWLFLIILLTLYIAFFYF